MLDTDSVSFALRGEGRVGAQILEHRPSELCVSAITVAELYFGVERRRSARLRTLVETFVANVGVLPFDDACARHFALLAAKLATRGTPIGDFDVLIAAHALAAGATLITNNTRHFTRVDGLAVENWF